MWAKSELLGYENRQEHVENESDEEDKKSSDDDVEDEEEEGEEEGEEDEEDDASLQPTSIFEYEQPTYTRMSPTLESSSSSHNVHTTALVQSSSNCFSQNSLQPNIKSQFYLNDNTMQNSSTLLSLNNANANGNLVKKKRGRKPKSQQNENCTINNSNSQFQVNENGNLKVIIISIVFQKRR
jgi:hypothetical protein